MQAALEVRDVAAVVEVNRNGDVGLLRHLDDGLGEDVAVKVGLNLVLEQVNDDRGVHLGCRVNYASGRLQVKGVDCHHGVALFVRLREHALHRNVHGKYHTSFVGLDLSREK